jgi:AsmA family protein
LRLGGVSLANGRVRYLDHRIPMAVTVLARPLDGQADALARRSDAPLVNNRYAMRFDISGQYRDNDFSGHAQSGHVVSLQDSGLPFPLQVDIKAGETRVQMEGTVADAAQLSGVDMREHRRAHARQHLPVPAAAAAAGVAAVRDQGAAAA